MASKNNSRERMQKVAERKPHFAIRKLTIGAASVLLGTTLWMGTQTSSVHADTVGSGDGSPESDEAANTKAHGGSVSAVYVQSNKNNENADQFMQGKQEIEKTTTKKSETKSVETSNNQTDQINVDKNAATTQKDSNTAQETQTNKAAAKTSTDQKTSNLRKANQVLIDNSKKIQNKLDKAVKSGASDQEINKLSQADVAKLQENLAKQTKDGKTTTLNLDQLRKSVGLSAAALAESKAEATDTSVVTVSSWQDLKNALANANIHTIKISGDIMSGESLQQNGDGNVLTGTQNAQTLATAEQKAGLSQGNANAFNKSSSSGFWGTIWGGLTATDITNGHQVTITSDNVKQPSTISVGANNKALKLGGSGWDITFKDINLNTDNQVGVLDLSQTSGKQTVNFNNVTSTGSALYNGGGDVDVHIQGNVNTTVSTNTKATAEQQGMWVNGSTMVSQWTTADSGMATNSAYSAINNNNRAAANLRASNLYIDKDATLNISRSVDGDGIVLADGLLIGSGNQETFTNRGNLNVGKNAHLNIALKDSSMTGDQLKSSERNNIEIFNNGIRINTVGHISSDANAHITMKVGHGRGINIGERENSTDPNSTANYTVRGDHQSWAGARTFNTTFKLGEGSTLDFMGREAFIFGHRTTFDTGEQTKIMVHTYGHGNGLGMDDFSKLNVDPYSDFEMYSDGKSTSGDSNWVHNNYVMLGEDGKINVEKNATLVVKLINRGYSQYNDNINIQSAHGHNPEVYVGNNATLDVQSDSQEGNDELISVPLPSSQSTKFIFDNVKYVNLQKTDIVKNAFAGPGGKAGNGNLLFMDPGSGSGDIIGNGNYVVFKWNDKNLNSNNVNWDNTKSVEDNIKRFSQLANQTWTDVTSFDMPFKHYGSGSDSGNVQVTTKNGQQAISNNGVAFSDKENGFYPTYSQRLVIISKNATVQPLDPDHPYGKYTKEVLNQEIGRDVNYKVVDQNGNVTGDMDPNKLDGTVVAHQTTNYQGTGYIDAATGNLVQVTTKSFAYNGGSVTLPVDADGDPIITDAQGHPIKGMVNENGVVVPKYETLSDGSGDYVYATNNEGQYIDENGNVLADQSSTKGRVKLTIGTSYQAVTDENGNVKAGKLTWTPGATTTDYVTVDKGSAKTDYQVKNGDFTYKDANGLIQHVTLPEDASGKAIITSANGQAFIAETNDDGTLKVDALGNPIASSTAASYSFYANNLNKTDGTLKIQNNNRGILTGFSAPTATGYKLVDPVNGQIISVDAGDVQVVVPAGTNVTDSNGNKIENPTLDQYLNYIATTYAKTSPTTKTGDGIDYLTVVNGNIELKPITIKYRADLAQQAKLSFVDDTLGGTTINKDDGTSYDHVYTGKAGASISDQFNNYPESIIKTLEDKGYDFKTVSGSAVNGSGDSFDNYTIANFDSDDNTTQTIIVHMIHHIDHITPHNPGDGYSQEQLHHTVSRTINYVGTPTSVASKVDSITFNGEGYYDKVGRVGQDGGIYHWVDKDGNLIDNQNNPLTWTAIANSSDAKVTGDRGQFSGIYSPSFDHYHITSVTSADGKSYGTSDGNVKPISDINHGSSDISITVNYAPDAKYQAKIQYIDQDEDNKVLNTVNAPEGYAGDTIQYSSASQLNKYEKQGYQLVSNGFDPNGDAPKLSTKGDNTYKIVLKHKTVDVTPQQDEANLVRHAQRTIIYQDTDGKSVKGSPDHTSKYVQNVYYVRTGIKDLVTGKYIGYDLNGDGKSDLAPEFGRQAWESAKKNADGSYTLDPSATGFAEVKSQAPKDVGYDSVDRAEVGYSTTGYDSPANTTEYVTYSKKSVAPTEKGSVVVNVKNDTNGQYITDVNGKNVGYNSGELKSGSSFNFADHDAQIKTLTDAGYDIVSDPTQDEGFPTKVANSTVTYTIHVKDHIDRSTDSKDVKENVSYTTSDGSKLPDNVHSVSKTLHFERYAYKDKVTGQWVDANGQALTDQSKHFGDWQAIDGSSFGSIVSPQVAGYHVSDVSNNANDGSGNVKEFAGIKANTQDINVVVTYSPNAAQATGTVTYIDDTTGNVLTTDRISGVVGQKTNYRSENTTMVNKYTGEGYILSSNDFQNGEKTFNKDAAKNVWSVHFTHNIVPVDPKHPDPQDGYDIAQLNKTSTRTIHYVLDDGNGEPDNQKPQMKDASGKAIANTVQTVHYTGSGLYDRTTHKLVNAHLENGKYVLDNDDQGKITWTTDESYVSVTPVRVNGYATNPTQVASEKPATNLPDKDNEDVYVVYKGIPADQKASLNFFDDTTGHAIGTTINANGAVNGEISFNGDDDEVKEILGDGYQFVKVTDNNGSTLAGDSYDQSKTHFGKYDADDANNQTFTVHFKHIITPVTPGSPDIHGANLTKTVTETVHYVNNDGTANPNKDKTFNVRFAGKAYYDEHTKEWVKDANGTKQINGTVPTIYWDDSTKNFAAVDSPEEAGYKVVSVKGNHIDYNDGQGNVKEIAGVTRNTPSYDITVTYAPVEQGTLKVNYVDSDQNNPQDLSSYDYSSGQEPVGTKVTYTTDGTLAQLTNKGYVLDKQDGTIPSTLTKGTTTVTVYVKHGTAPVDPQHPRDPKDPVIPTNPTGPKNPSGLTTDDLSKTITRTIEYVDQNGNAVAKTVTQPVTVTGHGTIDLVTGKLINGGIKWDSKDVAAVKAPVVANMHVVSVDHDQDVTKDRNGKDTANVIAKTFTNKDSNYTVRIVYADDVVDVNPNNPEGMKVTDDVKRTISYVNADGTEFSADQTAGFPTTQTVHFTATGHYDVKTGHLVNLNQDGSIKDQNGQLTWSPAQNFDAVAASSIAINGYHITYVTAGQGNARDGVASVSASHGDKDIAVTVVYTRNPAPQVSDQNANLHFYDVNDQNASLGSFTAHGKEKTAINFDGAGTALALLIHNGYAIDHVGEGVKGNLENGFTYGDYDTDSKKDQSFAIYLKHTTSTVDKHNTHGMTVTAQGTRTIHYVDENGTVSPDVVQTVNYQGTGTIDNVTGHLVNLNRDGSIKDQNGQLTWTVDGSNQGSAVQSPNIAGEHVISVSADSKDGINVDAAEIKRGAKDQVTVTYAHTIVPVTPDHPHDGVDPKTLTKDVVRTISYVGPNGEAVSSSVTQTVHFNGTVYLDTKTGKLVNAKQDKSGNWILDKDSTHDANVPTWNEASQSFDNVVAPNVTNMHVVSADDPNGDAVKQDGKLTGAVKSRTVSESSKDTAIVIHYADDTAKIDGDNPYGIDATDTVNRTITYVDQNGQTVAGAHSDTIHFTGHGTIDKKTGKLVNLNSDGSIKDENGKLTWTSDADNDSFSDVINPTIEGKHVVFTTPATKDLTKVAGQKVAHNSADINIQVVYANNAGPAIENAGLDFVDVNEGNKNLGHFNGSGDPGTAISFAGSQTSLDALIRAGYEFDHASDGIKGNINSGFTYGSFDNDPKAAQNFTIYLKHGTTTVDQNHPSNFKTTDQATRTINYQDEQGSQVANPVTQTVDYVGTGTVDKVTGKLVNLNSDGSIKDEKGALTWTPVQNGGQVAGVASPDIANMHVVSVSADQNGNDVAAKTLERGKNTTVVVTYADNIIPVDPNHPNDNVDMNTLTQTVTRTIHYIDQNGQTVASDKSQDVKFAGTVYIDAKTGKQVAVQMNNGQAVMENGHYVLDQTATPAIIWDQANKNFAGVTSPKITNMHVVSVSRDADGINVGRGTANRTTGNYEVNVVYADDTTTVDQKHPHKGVDTEKTITRTINYYDQNGAKIADSVTQEVHFIGSATLDLKTGNLVNLNTDGSIKDQNGQMTWKLAEGSSDNFAEVNNPAKDGYHVAVVSPQTSGNTASVKAVNGVKVTDSDSVVNVYYAPNGSSQQNAQTSTVSQTVHFVDDQGNVLSPENNQTLNFTKTPDTVDATTGKITKHGEWSKAQSFTKVTAPVITGYVTTAGEVEKLNATGQTVGHDGKNVDITVVYHKIGKIVPVDPEHNPIPDVPTPNYQNDPHDPTKVVPKQPVPNVPGYKPVDPTPITPKDPTKNTEVVYNNIQKAVITYIDQDEGNKVLKTVNQNGRPGDKIGYSSQTDLTNFENQGYQLVFNGYDQNGTPSFDNDLNTDQNFTITLKHGTTTVTPKKPGKPGEPINPNDPTGPKYPAGTDTNSLQVIGQQTIHYVDETGHQVAQDNVAPITFTKTMTIDKVTGEVKSDSGWNIASQNYPTVVSPNIIGYTPDKLVAGGSSVKPSDSTKVLNPVITVTYHKNVADGSLVINYVDQDNHGQLLHHDSVTGKFGDKITYTTTDEINTLTKLGYEVVSDGFTGHAGDEIGQNNNGKTYQVTLKHKIDHVDKNHPGGIDPSTLTATGQRTIHYVDETGHQVASDVVQTVEFNGSTYYDEVTKKQVNAVKGQDGKLTLAAGDPVITWDAEDKPVANVVSPDIAKMHIISVSSDSQDNKNVDAINLTHGQKAEVTVTYADNIVPVDPNHPQDQDGLRNSDLTKTITRTIHYVDQSGIPVATDKTQTVTFTGHGYYDEKTGKLVNAKQDANGNWVIDHDNSKTPAISWTATNNSQFAGVVSPKITNMHVVSVSADRDGDNVKSVSVDRNNSKNSEVTVTYADDTTTIDKNHNHGFDLTKTVTRTVNYLDNQGHKLAESVVQSHEFNATGTLDLRTGKLVGQLKWTPAYNYGAVTAKTSLTHNGKAYHQTLLTPSDQADGTDLATAGVKSTSLDHNSGNITVNIYYTENGQTTQGGQTENGSQTVRFVDENGQDIHTANVQSTSFTRTPDQVDAVTGKVIQAGTWTNAATKNDSFTYQDVDAPVIEGYVAEKASVKGATVDHNNPSANFKIVYHKIGKIVPVDPDHNPIPDVPTPTYKNDPKDPTKVVPNEPIPNIPGYKPVNPTPVTPKDPTKNTTVVYSNVEKAIVHYVDQDNNDSIITSSNELTGASGSTINYSTTDTIKDLESRGYEFVRSDYPADPSFDYNMDKDQVFTVVMKHGTELITPKNPHGMTVNKTITRTISYVDGDGHKIAEDIKQPANFTATGTWDKVNKRIIGHLTWNSDQENLPGVNSPSVPGMHIVSVSRDGHGDNVTGVTINRETGKDYTVTVTYADNIVPVDPNHPQDQDGLRTGDLQKSTTRTVTYVDQNGVPVHAATTETVNFTGHGYYDERTGKLVNVKQDADGNWVIDKDNTATPAITWDHTSQSFRGFNAPNVTNMHVVSVGGDKSKKTIDSVTVKPGDKNINVEVVYADDTAPVDKDHTHGFNVVKNVKRTINYLNGQGQKVSDTVVQNVEFDATGTVDLKTGKLIGGLTWSPAQNLAGHKSPVVTGMHIVNASSNVAGQVDDNHNVLPVGVNSNSQDVVVNIYYAPDGQTTKGQATKTITQTVHFVDDQGNEIHTVDQHQLTFNRTPDVVNATTGKVITAGKWDGNKKFENANIPVIPGYVADQGDYQNALTQTGQTVGHDHANINVTIHYHKIGQIVPVGPGNTPIPNVPTTPYQNDPSDPTKVVPNEPVPTIPGYKITNNPNPGKTPNTVTPNDPIKDTVVVYDNTERAIVHYIDTDNNNSEITNSGVLTGASDSVINYSTAQTINDLVNKGYKLVHDGFTTGSKFDNDMDHDQSFEVLLKHDTTTVTPENPGHPGEPINPQDPSSPKWPNNSGQDKLTQIGTQTVHYVGVDGGNPQDSVTTVKFTHSLTIDKVTGKVINDHGWTPATQTYTTISTPTVKGYTPDRAYVGGDTVKIDQDGHGDLNRKYTVTYHKTPVTPATVVATITYHDDTTGTDLSTDSVTGKVGDKINYNAETKISNYQAQGYEVVSNDFKDNPSFSKDGNHFIVHLKHGTINVTPKNPDPDHGYTTDILTKHGTQTVIYTGAGDHTPQQNTSTVTFDHTLTIDKVTGKVITDHGWTPSQTYTKVDVPTVNGYTPTIGGHVVTTVGGDTVHVDNHGNGDINRTYVVNYQPDVKKGSLIVTVHDETTNTDLSQYGYQVNNQDVGSAVSYDHAKVISDLIKSGYEIVKDVNVPSVIGNGSTSLTIVVKHGTEPINKDHNHGLTVTDQGQRTITYVDQNGHQVHEPTVQTVHYEATGTWDKVDHKPVGNLTWKVVEGDNQVTGVTPPDISGMHVVSVNGDSSKKAVEPDVLKRGDHKQITISYDVNAGAIKVHFIDDTTGSAHQNLSHYDTSVAGKVGSSIASVVDYTNGTIKLLIDHGYKLVSDGLTNAHLSGMPTSGEYEVHFVHTTIDITPDKPQDQTGLRYGDLNKQVTRTINYINNDGIQVHDPVVQTAHFTRTGVVDKVTGKLVGYRVGKDIVSVENGNIAWTSKDNNFDKVVSPTPESVGYNHVNISSVDTTIVSPNSKNSTITVTYTKNPTIVYHYGETETRTIHRVINYVDGVTGKAMLTNLAKSISQDVTFTRHAILDGNNHVVAYGVLSEDGKSYTIQDWKADQEFSSVTSPDLKNYGYTEPSIAVVAAETPNADLKDGHVETIIVKYGHQIITVPGTNPVKPDTPVDPKNPQGPKYPSGLDVTDLQKHGTQTVTYVDQDGKQIHEPDTQTITFYRNGRVDLVTGEKTYGNWSNAQTYNKVTPPTIDGYTTTTSSVGGDTIYPTDKQLNRTYKVTYTHSSQPVTPNTPENPTNPTTPAPTPKPEVPDKPNTSDNVTPAPVKPEEPENTNEETVSPQPQEVVMPKGYTVQKNGYVVNKKGQVSGYVDKHGKIQAELPQTGEKNDATLELAAELAGGLAATIGMIGLAGVKRRKRNK